jgi:hypothetical protein
MKISALSPQLNSDQLSQYFVTIMRNFRTRTKAVIAVVIVKSLIDI